ncbi:MAG: DEAD/DEAH box helicase family protein [Caldilineaceae bacterium]|nr:DEAD/DEAH box helicase family protein [Caldilineaceae bacterium]
MPPRTFVAVDVETTGLSPQKDAIIEIGAVRFCDGAIVDTFATFINPARPIPLFIQRLTNISDKDVADAPSMDRALPELLAFVDSSVFAIVGHNVGFDLAFLQAAGANFHRPGLDTHELATILLPSMPSYNLGQLCNALEIRLDDAHRANADAEATAQLFMHLMERLRQVPLPTLQILVERSAESGWSLRFLLEDALSERLSRVWTTPRLAWIHPDATEAIPPLPPAPASEIVQSLLVPETVEAAFAPDGPLARQLNRRANGQPAGQPDGQPSDQRGGQTDSQYETRRGQVEMAQLVLDAFTAGRHRMIEAGTGTGKSMAYLLPAALWATAHNRRAVIATNTIPLQEQLLEKEIPRLAGVLAEADPALPPLRAALLKGRQNYLCTQRLEQWQRGRQLSVMELRLLAKVLVWLPTTRTGDLSELSINDPAERAIWRQIASDPVICTEERCGSNAHQRGEFGSHDFYWQARRRAETAHLLVVNHALLLADVETGHRLLPAYDHLIIDEAHRLEEAATEALTTRTDRAQIEGALARLSFSREMHRHLDSQPEWQRQARQIEEAARTLPTPLGEIALSLFQFARGQEGIRAQADYAQRLRLDSGMRAQPRWSQIEMEWDRLSRSLHGLVEKARVLADALEQARWWADDTTGLFLNELRSQVDYLAELTGAADRVIFRPVGADEEIVTWLSLPGGHRAQEQNVELCAAPVFVGDLLEKKIFHRLRTVVLTGATLRTSEGFDFMQDRVGGWSTEVSAIASPFDYRSNVLLYLPSDMPAPDKGNYQQSVERAIMAGAKAAEGHTLVLFTSYAHLRATADSIRAPLDQMGIGLLEHGSGSRRRLLQEFRSGGRFVLMGTGTFWEGIDLPGEQLTCLLIVRLPFAVPTDPLVAARSATYDDSFHEYVVPDAVLRFRQGFGRLIRQATDRGVVVILDNRAWKREYGAAFLEALPSCTQRNAPLMNLEETVSQWLDNDPWLRAGQMFLSSF